MPTSLRIINRSSVPDSAKWDIFFSRIKCVDPEEEKEHLIKLICNTFSLTIADTDVVTDILVPSYSSSHKLVHRQDVTTDDHTYQSLSDIFNSLEKKSGKIVIYNPDANETYLDVFELGTAYYSMNEKVLTDWLRIQGVTFNMDRRIVKLKVLHNKY